MANVAPGSREHCCHYLCLAGTRTHHVSAPHSSRRIEVRCADDLVGCLASICTWDSVHSIPVTAELASGHFKGTVSTI